MILWFPLARSCCCRFLCLSVGQPSDLMISLGCVWSLHAYFVFICCDLLIFVSVDCNVVSVCLVTQKDSNKSKEEMWDNDATVHVGASCGSVSVILLKISAPSKITQFLVGRRMVK